MELRKDYLLDQFVIIAQKRSTRPHQFSKITPARNVVDYFAAGSERHTPKEIGRIGGKKWKMRWFPNKFPAAEPKGNHGLQRSKYFSHADSYGYHEIVVETPSKTKQLWDLSAQDFRELLEIFKNRIQELSKKPHINYVQVFKNHGSEGGASILHSHSQILATFIVPPTVKDLISASSKSDPFGAIIDQEKSSPRRCFENEHAVAFTPYASRFQYELWIFPKESRLKPQDCTAPELDAMADLLQKALLKLKKINAPYNFALHYSPRSPGFRFHIKLTPRLGTWAGYETATGIIINTVSPETAASFYRSK